MKKTIKCWAIVNDEVDAGMLQYREVEPLNGPFGSGLAFPLISTNEEWIKSWFLEGKERVVPCKITLEI